MKQFTKKIVFINIPHLFIEAERIRRGWDDDTPCVIASGDSPTSLIIDVSDNLYRKNIRRGMLLKDVKHLAAESHLIPVDFDDMRKVNRAVISYLKDYSIIVESSNFGEFYIDLTGTEKLFGRTMDTCGRIISHLHDSYGFNTRIGIGSSRLTSYLASKIIRPNSAYEIPDTSENIFLDPVNPYNLPDIPREVKKEILWSYNIQTISEIRAFSRDDLIAMFRESGSMLYDYSRNISSSNLVQREEKKIIRQETVLSDIANDDEMIRRRFFQLLLEMCMRMRKEMVIPLRFYLQVIYKDDYKFSSNRKIQDPTFIERRLYKEILPYLEKALERRICLKKIVVTFSRFIPAVIQASLFPDEDKDLRLCNAFDKIRDRYGKNAIFFVE